MILDGVVSLTRLNVGDTAKVVHIAAGLGLRSKLEALGIREGTVITKKSMMLHRGPIIVSIGNSEIAMGHGMADKIKVEVLKK